MKLIVLIIILFSSSIFINNFKLDASADSLILENDKEAYRRYLKKRGIKKIIHHSTTKLKHPDLKDMENFDTINYIWKTGDRFFKLADKYYGDPKYRWVIAWYNKKPTESHLKIGDVIKIPLPLYKVLGYMRNA